MNEAHWLCSGLQFSSSPAGSRVWREEQDEGGGGGAADQPAGDPEQNHHEVWGTALTFDLSIRFTKADPLTSDSVNRRRRGLMWKQLLPTSYWFTPQRRTAAQVADSAPQPLPFLLCHPQENSGNILAPELQRTRELFLFFRWWFNASIWNINE